jgi:hypothetical protein
VSGWSVNNILERIWKEAVFTILHIILWHLQRGTEEDNENLRSVKRWFGWHPCRLSQIDRRLFECNPTYDKTNLGNRKIRSPGFDMRTRNLQHTKQKCQSVSCDISSLTGVSHVQNIGLDCCQKHLKKLLNVATGGHPDKLTTICALWLMSLTAVNLHLQLAWSFNITPPPPHSLPAVNRVSRSKTETGTVSDLWIYCSGASRKSQGTPISFGVSVRP